MLPDDLSKEMLSKTERNTGQGGGRKEGFACFAASEGLHAHTERPYTQPSLRASQFSHGSL